MTFHIDNAAKTVTARNDKPIHLFYYWTGSRNKPYQSLRRYEISRDFKPASGKITLSSVIGPGVLQEIECTDSGTVIVAADIQPCVIALYCVSVSGKNDFFAEYVVLAGMSEFGQFLSDEECHTVFALPVVSFVEDGRRSVRWLRESTGSGGRPYELDRLILPDEYTRRAIDETDSAVKEEIERQRMLAADRKAALDRDIETLRTEVGVLTGGLDRASSIAEKIQAEKKKAAAQKELKQREQQLFPDGMRLDLELEEQIKHLTDAARFKATVKRQFVISLIGSGADA